MKITPSKLFIPNGYPILNVTAVIITIIQAKDKNKNTIKIIKSIEKLNEISLNYYTIQFFYTHI